MRRHGEAFLEALKARADIAQAEFEAIDALDFQIQFGQAMEVARSILDAP
jgi:hypothetical protein